MTRTRDNRLYELHDEICQTLSHPKRLEILDCLRDGEKNVKELSQLIGGSQSAISRFLAGMRQMDIVIPRRQGKKVFYRLGNPKILEAYDLMSQVLLEYQRGHTDLIEATQRDAVAN
jgi:DNA-binding transcriptional ArsR family regulator